MSKPTPSTCNTCGASIYWTIDATTGRKAPIDAEPTDNGNVLLAIAPNGVIKSRVLKKGEDAGGAPVRLNHFVTCTNPPRRKGWHSGGTPG